MKIRILMLAVLAVSMAVFAQPPPPSSPPPSPLPTQPPLKVESVKQQKTQAPKPSTIVIPLVASQPVVTPKVWRVDGMSSRPWMQIVGLHPGWPAIPRPERHEATWRILQINF